MGKLQPRPRADETCSDPGPNQFWGLVMEREYGLSGSLHVCPAETVLRSMDAETIMVSAVQTGPKQIYFLALMHVS